MKIGAWHKKQRKLFWPCAWHRASRFELPYEKTTGEMKSIHVTWHSDSVINMRRQENRNENYFGVVLDIAYRASRFAARKNKLHITHALKFRQKT